MTRSVQPPDIIFAQTIYAKIKELNMWEAVHSIETSAPPEAVWRLWSDVAGWPSWNADIERIEVDGPFAAGTTIAMKPFGEETVRLRIVDAVEPVRFVDEADLGEVVVRTVHSAEPLDGGGTRVTYRMEIGGPAADALGPQIGPAISGDFPQTLAALAALAES